MTRVEELTMLLLDEAAGPIELEELEQLVAGDPAQRAIYLTLLEQEAVLRSMRDDLNLVAPTLERIWNETGERVAQACDRR